MKYINLGKSGLKVSPIIGASKMPHLEEAVAGLEIELTEDETASLEDPYRPHPVLGHT